MIVTAQFLKLPPIVARRLQPAIERLAENPRPDGVKKLRVFKNQYRIRVGDYRVIYRTTAVVLHAMVGRLLFRDYDVRLGALDDGKQF